MKLKNLVLFFFTLHFTTTHGYMYGPHQQRKMKRSDLVSFYGDGNSEFSGCGAGGGGGSGGGGSSGGSSSGSSSSSSSCNDFHEPISCDSFKKDGEQKPSSSSGGGGSSASRTKATSIAQKAAAEAKEAEEEQAGAAVSAAHAIKQQLAERAHQAAIAAEAALAGKKQIVDELEHEVHEAEGVVQEECSSMQSAEVVVNAAVQAHEQANRILKLLTQALAISQTHVGNAETAAQGAQAEFAEKGALLDAAKNRVELLLRQLTAARADLASTKSAENVAEHAAQAAKHNCDRVRRRLFRD